MTYKKVGGRKNHGYGRSLEFAVRCALRDGYGHGRFSTRKTYESKVNGFIGFMRGEDIHDFNDVRREHVVEYANRLYLRVRAGEFSLNYAVGCLSAVNCVLSILCGGDELWVSPREFLGPRLFVRQDAPETLDVLVVEAAAIHLEENDEIRLAGVLRLCSTFGLRFKEASLLDVEAAKREARRSGCVTVTKGTKGGRSRSISVGTVGIDLLDRLGPQVSPDSKMVPENWSFLRWKGYCYRIWRKYAQEIGIDNRFKELRAGFACRIYSEVTGAPAPVLAGGRVVDRNRDRIARLLIATELGHCREQIAGAYVGTSRRAPA